MENFASTTLWLTSLVLPALLFLVANSFKRTWHTLIRAAIAIGCGWAFVFSYAIAANTINLSLARTEAKLLMLSDADGAPLAFAATLGWVLPAVLVFATWGIHSIKAKCTL